MNARRAIGLIVATCVLATTWSAHAAFGRRDVADRDDVAPLRNADLLAAIDGRSIDESWRAAAGELPKKCQVPASLDAEICDPQLRCAWLSARAAALDAFSGKSRAKRAQAVTWLHRAADRLAPGGACKDSDGNYARDRKQAATDAAAAQLAMFSGASRSDIDALLDSRKQQRFVQLVAQSKKSGVRGTDKAAMRALRLDMRTAWQRYSWLHQQPALKELREQAQQLWEPVGGRPRGCGDQLFRPELLGNQYRGMLVRESAPQLLRCLSDKYPSAARRRGKGVGDEQGARQLAHALASQAASDSSGLTFGKDRTVLGQIGQLATMLGPSNRSSSSSAARSSAPAPEPSRGTARREPAADRPSRTTKRSARREPAARSPASPPQRTPRASGSFDSLSTSKLIELAQRTATLVGQDRNWTRRAQSAPGAKQRHRLQKEMLIAVHRVACAPLDRSDPGDRDAMRGWLRSVGWDVDERACEGDGLERLIEATPALQRLWAATTLRTSSRLVALDRHREARDQLDAFPKNLRGVTWAVVYAWAARKAGDSEAASHALSHVDSATLDRLRASGLEELARLMAHATVAPRP